MHRVHTTSPKNLKNRQEYLNQKNRLHNAWANNIWFRAVVVARLAEQSLLVPKDPGLKPASINFCVEHLFTVNCWKDESKEKEAGREPWSSGNGWWLMFWRSWVQISAPYTRWSFRHFLTLICCKNCIVCLKRPKINEKEAGVGPLKKEKRGLECRISKTIRFYYWYFHTKPIHNWKRYFWKQKF